MFTLISGVLQHSKHPLVTALPLENVLRPGRSTVTVEFTVTHFRFLHNMVVYSVSFMMTVMMITTTMTTTCRYS